MEDERINYKKQVEIPKLKGDYADYRIADFYIPKYKVYVEFLGKWRDYEINKKYHFKKELYEKNKIPCIYIHPDNLGALQFIFYMRLREQLEKYPKLKFQLFKYNFTIYRQIIGLIWLTTFCFIVFITFNAKISKLEAHFTSLDYWLVFIMLIFAITTSIFTLKKVFFKKSLNNQKI